MNTLLTYLEGKKKIKIKCMAEIGYCDGLECCNQFEIECYNKAISDLIVDMFTDLPNLTVLLEKEIIICAAIKYEDKIIRGHRHADCIHTAQRMGLIPHPNIQGFITSKNRFVGRGEAFVIQHQAGIKSADMVSRGTVDELGYFDTSELYSEDLY